MAENEELELLDLEDDVLPELPEDNPFEQVARPKRPWLLFGAAILVIALASYIIIRVIGKDYGESIDINIDMPPAAVQPAPEPLPESEDRLIIDDEQQDAGTPVRVVEDRVDAQFDPNAAPRVEPPKPRPVQRPQGQKPRAAAPKPAAKPQPVQSSSAVSGWSVQFGSYATRAAAQSGESRLRSRHSNLFADHTFVILAAVLPDGSTTYRLRVTGFQSGSEANGFCRNAKSDGLDCYVAR
ncbi:MAG: SPOR domain-containing protein [Alphaproteobacteria bacterium]|nr:SPOR domain-containing protein [Alphaproteobacteria bacterium]